MIVIRTIQCGDGNGNNISTETTSTVYIDVEYILNDLIPGSRSFFAYFGISYYYVCYAKYFIFEVLRGGCGTEFEFQLFVYCLGFSYENVKSI